MRFAATVVLPARNAADVVEQQLQALAAQELRERWEVILVDDASTDGTASVLERWASRRRDARLLRTSPLGTAGARNLGVEHARSDRLVFCDADDVVWPGWLAAHVAALEVDELVAGAFDHRRFRPSGERLDGARVVPPGTTEWLPFADTANASVRRGTFEGVGGFDAGLTVGSDKDFSWRVQVAGTTLRFEPSAVVSKRPRADLRGTFRQFYRYGRGNPVIFGKLRSSGMPRTDPRYIALRYWWLATSWRRMDEAQRLVWTQTLALHLGRAVGSARTRTLYL